MKRTEGEACLASSTGPARQQKAGLGALTRPASKAGTGRGRTGSASACRTGTQGSTRAPSTAGHSAARLASLHPQAAGCAAGWAASLPRRLHRVAQPPSCRLPGRPMCGPHWRACGLVARVEHGRPVHHVPDVRLGCSVRVPVHLADPRLVARAGRVGVARQSPRLQRCKAAGAVWLWQAHARRCKPPTALRAGGKLAPAEAGACSRRGQPARPLCT